MGDHTLRKLQRLRAEREAIADAYAGAIVTAYHQGHTNTRIAEHAGVSEAAVRLLLKRRYGISRRVSA